MKNKPNNKIIEAFKAFEKQWEENEDRQRSREEDAESFILKVLSQQRQEIKRVVERELTPHEFVSDDPKIERIVQDEKIKHKKEILKAIDKL